MLCCSSWGYPPVLTWDLTWMGGTLGPPILTMDGGPPNLGWGHPPIPVLTWDGGITPSWSGQGVPPILTWDEVPPSGRMGYPSYQEGRGYPPSAGWKYFHPLKCERTDACENITFPFLRNAGGKNWQRMRTVHRLEYTHELTESLDNRLIASSYVSSMTFTMI